MTKPPPALLLGFDATEIELIDRLIEEGRMPYLARLRERGRWGRLRNRPEHFLSLVWSTFFTSSRLERHGWYFNKLWNCQKQQIQYVDPSWLPQRPFWEDMEERFKVAILDLPYVSNPPPGPNQTLLAGWQCHDDFGDMEKPPGQFARLRTKLGKTAMEPEIFGPQTAKTLLAIRKETLASTAQFADIVADYLERDRWDLLIAVFGGAHRATHYLWDLSQIDTEDLDNKTLNTLSGARDECYEYFDQALGRVLEAAPEDARILAFALHGMGPNNGWYEYLPRLVERVHNGGAARETASRKGLAYGLKQALPWNLVRQATRRIPHSWNRALVPLWSRRMYDWSKTRYFCLPMDYNGYIRLNLKGREAKGCLDPEDAEREIQRLEKGLESFRDLETGRPLIKGVVRVEELIGEPAPRRDVLPDLIVLWEADFPTAESSGVTSDLYGEIRWPKGRKLASGRSGNHTPNAWFAAAGPGIEPGPASAVHDTIDLAPTVLKWLGAAPIDRLSGKAIEELLPKRDR